MLSLIGLAQTILIQQSISDLQFKKTQLQAEKMEAAELVEKLPDYRTEQRGEVKRFLMTALSGLNFKIKKLETADTALSHKLQMMQAGLQENRQTLQQPSQGGYGGYGQ